MATKAKKKSPEKKAAPENAKPSPEVKKDPKTMDKEITNALFTDEERAGMFFARHWKKLIAAAVILVLAVTGVFAYIYHRKAAQEAATAKLAQAKTIDALQTALAAHPKAKGADDARFRMAKLYEGKKKYGDAIKVLEELVSVSEDASNRNRAQLAIAYLLECEGKKEDAAKKFATLAGNTALPVADRAEAAYSAARLYVDLKKTEDAQLAFKTIKSLDPDKKSAAAMWQKKAEALENTLD